MEKKGSAENPANYDSAKNRLPEEQSKRLFLFFLLAGVISSVDYSLKFGSKRQKRLPEIVAPRTGNSY